MTVQLRPTIVTLDGLALFVLTGGEDRIPLLILHGFASSAVAWAPLLQHLAAERRVVAYDRPGFGLTQVRCHRWRGFDPYAPSAQAPVALALLDHLGIEQCYVLGHSMGGRMAVDLAHAAAERVAALILVAPAWERPSAPRLAPLARTTIGSLLGRSFLRVLSPLALRLAQRAIWAGPPPPGGVGQSAVAASLIGWDTALWQVTAATLAERRLAPPEGLSRPTLVILGEHDRIVPNKRTLEVIERWRAAGAPVRLERFQHSGHLPHVEESERFVAVVRDFLEEVERGTARSG